MTTCALLERDPTDADLAAEREPPRPGSWYGDPDADGRMLTQHQTDVLIRSELVDWALANAPDEIDAVTAAVGGPGHMVAFDLHMGRASATRQRGGIDSDPLVRILAQRVWGDLDRRWFRDRGVRAGEPVTVLAESNAGVVTCVWLSEPMMGTADHDARPGVLLHFETRPGHKAMCHVGGRLRVDPEVARMEQRRRFPDSHDHPGVDRGRRPLGRGGRLRPSASL